MNRFLKRLLLASLFPTMLVAQDTPLTLEDEVALVSSVKVAPFDPETLKSKKRELPERDVISVHRVREGGRTITLEKVVFEERPSTPQITPAPSPQVTEPIAIPEETVVKDFQLFLLSATTYQGQSLLRWTFEGTQMVSLSNVPFELFEGVSSFSSQDTEYQLIMSLGATTQQPWPDDVPELGDFGSEGPQFVLLEGPEETPENEPFLQEAVKAVRCLHLLAMKETEALKTAMLQRRENRKARAEYLKNHPKKPQDVTIQYAIRDAQK